MPKLKPWTVRNAESFLIEKLGIESHALQMILKNTLDAVAEHYVFEGQKMQANDCTEKV